VVGHYRCAQYDAAYEVLRDFINGLIRRVARAMVCTTELVPQRDRPI
jgi:hypothetical protein